MQAGMARFSFIVLLPLALGLTVIAALAWFLWLAPQNGSDDYLTAEVQRSDIEDSVTALGTLGPLEYVDVGY